MKLNRMKQSGKKQKTLLPVDVPKPNKVSAGASKRGRKGSPGRKG